MWSQNSAPLPCNSSLFNNTTYQMCCGLGLRSQYSDLLRTGLSRIISQWRWGFPHPSRPALGPMQPPIQWVLGPWQR